MGLLYAASETTFRGDHVLIHQAEVPANVQLVCDFTLPIGTIAIRETYPRFGDTIVSARMEGNTLVVGKAAQDTHSPADKGKYVVKNTGNATAVGHGSSATTGISFKDRDASGSGDAKDTNVTYHPFYEPEQVIKHVGGRRKVEIAVYAGCMFAVV